jgi:hypothetical protein
MERFDTINALGQLGARRYNAPEDYALPLDETPTRDTFRVELASVLRGNGAVSSTTKRRARAR